MKLLRTAILSAAMVSAGAAYGQISDNLIKIGVLSDMSGLYADLGGPGSVLAARLAVEDFKAKEKA